LYDYLRRAAPPVEDTNRRKFLAKLQTRYNRRREDDLRGAVLIVLGLQDEPEALIRPALTVRTLTEGERVEDVRALPAGTGIAQAYEEAGGQLLILGAPGAGKTTLIVELGLDIVRRTRADGKLPLPVICNLSTWAINRRSLAKWLVEDLVETYQVPQSVARSWVSGKEVLPLLDGLDEVDVAQRAACVKAINMFHQDHPQLPLVVCSRIEEFRAQGVSLALQRAVVVQPLTDDQIDAYLAYGGEDLAALRAAVGSDATLRDVLRTPLLLRVVALTYEGLPQDAIPRVGDHEDWVRRVFGEYVARMLKRRRRLESVATDSPEEVEQPEYPPEDAERYLSWLAGQMRAHGLVELYLERLQPDWLPDARARWRYQTAGGLLFGPGMGLLFGLGLGLSVGRRMYKITPTAAVQWSWQAGLFGALFGALPGVLNGALPLGLDFGLFFGLFCALGIGLSGRQVDDQDYRTPNEDIRRSVRFAVVTVLACMLIFELLFGPLFALRFGLFFGVGIGLYFGLRFGPLVALPFGLDAALHHAVLRWVLQQAKLVPPHPVRFLNYAADHVLLQQVGGGYRFVHVLLRDYFADLSSLGPGIESMA